MIAHLSMLAQDAPSGTNGPPQGGAAGMLPFVALMFAMIVFLFLTTRSQRKREQRQREQMYASLSKNDRVHTVGGIVGTVMAVKDNEVVLKVDESNNIKMTFLKSAIQRIITEEAPGEGKSKK
jgi:preprotein translocase subunit YajC